MRVETNAGAESAPAGARRARRKRGGSRDAREPGPELGEAIAAAFVQRRIDGIPPLPRRRGEQRDRRGSGQPTTAVRDRPGRAARPRPGRRLLRRDGGRAGRALLLPARRARRRRAAYVVPAEAPRAALRRAGVGRLALHHDEQGADVGDGIPHAALRRVGARAAAVEPRARDFSEHARRAAGAVRRVRPLLLALPPRAPPPRRLPLRAQAPPPADCADARPPRLGQRPPVRVPRRRVHPPARAAPRDAPRRRRPRPRDPALPRRRRRPRRPQPHALRRLPAAAARRPRALRLEGARHAPRQVHVQLRAVHDAVGQNLRHLRRLRARLWEGVARQKAGRLRAATGRTGAGGGGRGEEGAARLQVAGAH